MQWNWVRQNNLPVSSKYFLFALTVLAFRSAEAQTLTVSAQPTLSIGEAEGEPEYMLNRVAHVKRLRDGRILITMGPDIRFYDATGKYVSKAGGRGRGPGEFQYIQDLLVLPGDTLVALNFRDKVWLDPQGKYVRQERMELAPLAGDGWFSEGGSLLPNGNFLAMQYAQEVPNDPRMKELHRPTLRYTILDIATKKIQPLIVSGGLRQMKVGERGSSVQPFTPHAQHAVGRDRVFVGDNDTTFVSVFAFDGKPLGTIRVADRAVPVTTKDLDEYRARTLEFVKGDANRKAEFERGWAAVPKPKRHPYWGTAQVDKLGHLWVSPPQIKRQAAMVWTVFDQTGKRLASVTMPAGFIPKEIGADYVLGVARDEFDVEYVRMYALQRR